MDTPSRCDTEDKEKRSETPVRLATYLERLLVSLPGVEALDRTKVLTMQVVQPKVLGHRCKIEPPRCFQYRYFCRVARGESLTSTRRRLAVVALC